MDQFIRLVLDPEFMVTALVGVAVFATMITILLPLLEADRLSARMKSVALRREELRNLQRDALGRRGTQLRPGSKNFMRQTIEALNLREALESANTREKLGRAGFRGPSAVYTFLFFRFVMPIIIFVAANFYLFVVGQYEMQPLVKVALAVAMAFLGFYLPDLYVQNTIDKRMASIMKAFPDGLDLLLICVEAGMSVEAAFNKVASEIGTQSVELAEEFALTTAELSYLPDRRQAYENLSKRCGHPGVKAVCTSLIQAERYGTPLGTALRVMALENREMRMMEAEKKAAALPAKLTVPMIIFFLPVLFAVIIGPAVIKIMKL
jgi:tight adherence protein C